MPDTTTPLSLAETRIITLESKLDALSYSFDRLLQKLELLASTQASLEAAQETIRRQKDCIACLQLRTMTAEYAARTSGESSVEQARRMAG